MNPAYRQKPFVIASSFLEHQRTSMKRRGFLLTALLIAIHLLAKAQTFHAAIASPAAIPNQYILLDNFNRNDTIRPAIPSMGGPAWWNEVEPGLICSVLQTVRIKSNRLELSGCDNNGTTCLLSPTQTASMNMTLANKYPTVFANAAGTMEWYFNMQQNRADPNGFGGGQYGVAFVIGSNTNDPNPSLTKYGYAVIFGESGTTDPIRLVSYNGTSFNSTTFTNILSVPSPAVKTNYMSLKVSFNPCTSEWTLTVRDDGASAFADPATVTGVGASAVNSTFTSSNLLWMGMVWNHGSSCSLAKFDNVYIPNVGTKTGTYIWNGSFDSDFQSPYNWTPVRQCISTTDKLVFNSSSPANCVITNVPTQTIGQLTVSNNRTVTISDVAGDGVSSTLSIGGASGTDLQVDAGSSLVFDVSTASLTDAIQVSLSTGATASIAGTVSFSATPGGGRPHRLLAADAAAITVTGTGMVKAMALSGNPFGNSLPQQTVVFNAGAVYECYSGGDPFGLAAPASKVLFNSGSIYRHYATTAPSIFGRTYADFESYSAYTVSDGDASVMVADNFKVLAGSAAITGAANGLPVSISLKKDLAVSLGATFTYDPSAASVFSFNGSSNAQKITNAGNLVLGKNSTVRLNSTYATAPQLSVESNISLAGILDIVQGTIKLNGNITLLSRADATASVAPVTGAISYGAGRFVVERFMSGNRKAWQLLAVPTTGQTINAAWQEANLPMGNATPGYGTLITNNVPGTGFDVIGGTGPSMKTYDTAGAGSWKGISRTDTAIYNSKGYMVFVRGDRSVTTTAAPANQTILRTTGKIFEPGNPAASVQVGNGKFECTGNPYPSAIDFSNDIGVTKSANIQRVFYVWDPNLGTGLGAFQTFIKGIGTDYAVIPGGGSYPPMGSVSNYIQSGQAFFVRTFGGSGTVGFNENAKVAGSSLVTRPGGNISSRNVEVKTTLYTVAPGNQLLDGVLTEASAYYANNIGSEDVIKIPNTGESISILNEADTLVAERRSLFRTRDTIQYCLEKLKMQDYELAVNITGLPLSSHKVYLQDVYTGINTPVSLTQGTRLRFSVNTTPASYAAKRFRLIFRKTDPHVKGIVQKAEKTAEINVYPNPLHPGNVLNIAFEKAAAGIYRLDIISVSGVSMASGQFKLNKGALFINWVLPPGIRPGAYNLRVQMPDGKVKASSIVVEAPEGK